MLKGLFAILLDRLIDRLLRAAIDYFKGQEKKAVTEADIDKKVAELTAAHKEAFDGNEISPEQRERLTKAIRNFIRNSPTDVSGL